MNEARSTTTTRIRAGDSNSWYPAHDFCKENFGPGGVQKGRRWFARIITPVTIEVYHDKSWGRTRHRRSPVADRTEDYTVVYFRNPADAVWFSLKFGVTNGNV
jgi:hypothetical protein